MAKEERRELSWTPVRRGTIYCAPACGAKCKVVEFDAAGIAAGKLVDHLNKEMKCDDWEPYVHENLGWHYSVVNERLNLSVTESFYDGDKVGWYSAYVKSGWNVVGKGRSAMEAVNDLVSSVRGQFDKMKAMLETITGEEVSS